MKPGEIQMVSEELSANLPPCPKCDQRPVIFKRLAGIPPRPLIAVTCPDCDGYENGIYREVTPLTDPRWHPSLFEAVNIWSLTAKLLGSVESQPERVEGSTYYDEDNNDLYVWQGGNWVLAEQNSSDVPF